MTTMTTRIRQLNDKPVLENDTCVLYVMARDQRLRDNHALAAAQAQALELQVPFAVVFCLQPGTGNRAREHYGFMLAGLREVEQELVKQGVPFMMLIGKAQERLRGVMHHLRPAAVYFDFNPLRGPMHLHQTIADEADCVVYEVDTHNIVPARMASDKQEYGARTLRTKIQRLLPDCLADEAAVLRRHPHTWPGVIQPMQMLQPLIKGLLAGVKSNGTDISRFKSGEKAAYDALVDFIKNRLRGYADNRNDPSVDGQSELNPYFHYGQLASAAAVRAVEVAAAKDGSLRHDADIFIEEVTVRKELSDNFCLYNPDYDTLAGAPQWAQKTLAGHAVDHRGFSYSREQFENAETHDPAWNAAQRQLTRSGKMHGYMRMYWAKKVLEWSASPQQALDTLLYLNDFYHIDGGDPNGYVGILWSIAGLHDRPWGGRPIYGNVRSMVYGGLKRKFDIVSYEQKWSAH